MRLNKFGHLLRPERSGSGEICGSLPMTAISHSPKIFLSAGEASGEHYGALLMTEIRRLAPQAEFFGLGGTRMASLGLRRVVRAEDVAVMGITEVILHMPHIYGEYRKLKASVRAERPDIAILIDFPDVNLSLAAELRRLHIPVVYFVSPQIWAWKKWRIKGVRRNVTRMLVIFPFEEAFYRTHGIAADFVGHPLADLDRPTVTREAFASENGLDASKFWVGLLPGSRTRELLANLPPMLETARLLGPEYEYLLPVAPTLKDAQVQALAGQAKGVDRAGGSRCPRRVAARARQHRSQRHGHRRGGADRQSLRSGLPGLSHYLCGGAEGHPRGPCGHGQPDRRTPYCAGADPA